MFFPCLPFILERIVVKKFMLSIQLFCFLLVDNSTTPTNGGKLSKKQIALITLSAVVGCITALFAIYVIR